MGPGFESQRNHNIKNKKIQSRIDRRIYAAFLFFGNEVNPIQSNLKGYKKGYTKKF